MNHYIGTVLVLLVLAAIVTLIVLQLIRNKKKDVSSCGCNCSDCAMHGSCHSRKKQ